ncbi:MAG: tetratricopeptide repeat protein, partial [Alphaproteobacteria bacterium]|nr:tetratricopeptide repeat protein [Alphaproteobacteria bacterium]
MGAVLAAQNRYADAEQAFLAALAIDPAAVDVLYNLGLLRQMTGRHDAAADCYRKVLTIAGPSPELFINLAKLRMAAGALIEPASLLERALELRPQLVEARQTLAQLYALRGDIDAAVAQRDEAIRIQPDRPELYRELILDLNFVDGDDGSRVAAACREWHRRFAATPALPLFRDVDRDPDRPLRVGYVGGEQFRGHTLAAVALPLVEAHGDAVELTCYSDLPPEREDDITRRFQRRMRWRRTSGLSDERFAQTVADDRIDILLDPVGFTGGSRLLALARRPAPLQISFPVMGTCGGSTMDYVLVDDGIAPDATLKHFSERALHVPFAYCNRPLSGLPDIAEPPCARSGVITFGSFNVLPKISRRAIRAWRDILEQVEHSRLLVKAGFPFRDPMVQ